MLIIVLLQTIFAVPAFKFDNQWVDAKFNPINGSTDDNGLATPTDAIKPVFSGYGIIFISISTLLTGITFSAYLHQKWRATREDEDDLAYTDHLEKDPNASATGMSGIMKKYQGGSSSASSMLSSLRATVADGVFAAFNAVMWCLCFGWLRGRKGYHGKSTGSPV